MQIEQNDTRKHQVNTAVHSGDQASGTCAVDPSDAMAGGPHGRVRDAAQGELVGGQARAAGRDGEQDVGGRQATAAGTGRAHVGDINRIGWRASRGQGARPCICQPQCCSA